MQPYSVASVASSNVLTSFSRITRHPGGRLTWLGSRGLSGLVQHGGGLRAVFGVPFFIMALDRAGEGGLITQERETTSTTRQVGQVSTSAWGPPAGARRCASIESDRSLFVMALDRAEEDGFIIQDPPLSTTLVDVLLLMLGACGWARRTVTLTGRAAAEAGVSVALCLFCSAGVCGPRVCGWRAALALSRVRGVAAGAAAARRRGRSRRPHHRPRCAACHWSTRSAANAASGLVLAASRCTWVALESGPQAVPL